jgi:hypothetical protein
MEIHHARLVLSLFLLFAAVAASAPNAADPIAWRQCITETSSATLPSLI